MGVSKAKFLGYTVNVRIVQCNQKVENKHCWFETVTYLEQYMHSLGNYTYSYLPIYSLLLIAKVVSFVQILFFMQNLLN